MGVPTQEGNACKITKWKARSVGRGCRRAKGVDFDEAFSPAVQITTLRFLFPLSAEKSWKIFQLDVQTAYLHGRLKEIV